MKSASDGSPYGKHPERIARCTTGTADSTNGSTIVRRMISALGVVDSLKIIIEIIVEIIFKIL